MRKFVGAVSCLFLASCGGGAGDQQAQLSAVSTGPKIFVTAAQHVGDFKNDPLLQGATAIEKADYFCNIDANKPNDSHYKALLVDGVSRDAVTDKDWVLSPDTTYYRSHGDVVIGKTTSSATFPVLYADLTNSVSPMTTSFFMGNTQPNQAWTGIGNTATWAAGSDCADWSEATNSSSGVPGQTFLKDAYFITNGGSTYSCAYRMSLYCVEQPQ